MNLGHRRLGWGGRLRPCGRLLLAVRGLILLLALLAGGAQAAPAATAVGLRFGENGSITRIVVDFDRKVSFAARSESDPDRLVIDLGAVAWQLDGDAGRPPRGLARGYEVASSPDGSRLTIALAGQVRVANALLLPPSRDSAFHRLVVDVVAAQSAGGSPAAAAVAVPAPVAAVPIRPAAGPPAAADRHPVPIPATRPRDLAAVPRGGATASGKAATRASERPVIVLDPGHGGIDPGAIAAGGLKEKDLVLEMARELRNMIERSGRYRVVLTRDGDEFIRLRDRSAKARQLGGQVFISLHADSLRLTELRGASIYTLSEKASDEEAAKFAALENKSDVLSGADLSQHDAVVATILIDLAQRDTNNRSIAFADLLSEELASVTSLVKRHRRFAGFAVLKSPDVPSVLLELGYLSNPDEARNLAQPDYRAKLGHAIVRALDRYFAVPKS